MHIREIVIVSLVGVVIASFVVSRQSAPAQEKTRRRFPRGKTVAKTFYRYKTKTAPYYRPSKSYPGMIPQQRTSALRIAAGQFGLELTDGTRLVGVPEKSWAATVKSRFGTVTIPRNEIAGIETVDGKVRVYLKNGDRVSGTWASSTMRFETQFGALTVPASSMVRLITGSSTQQMRSRPSPGRPAGRAVAGENLQKSSPSSKDELTCTTPDSTSAGRRLHDRPE
ncbi:MAG: hypothetical protein ACE5KM_14400 [Planctomycetaceae bacterium]